MKARLAKKIIKASATYGFYCRECDTHSRFKYHPYWTSHWNHNGSQLCGVPSAIWTFDQRLNAALRRLPQYAQKLSSAVKEKLMEIRRNRLQKMYERVNSPTSGKEGNSNGKADFSISSKMECL